MKIIFSGNGQRLAGVHKKTLLMHASTSMISRASFTGVGPWLTVYFSGLNVLSVFHEVIPPSKKLIIILPLILLVICSFIIRFIFSNAVAFLKSFGYSFTINRPINCRSSQNLSDIAYCIYYPPTNTITVLWPVKFSCSANQFRTSISAQYQGQRKSTIASQTQGEGCLEEAVAVRYFAFYD